MQFSENLKQAFSSLCANKLRSILTMIGIIMGVFSVVAIMAIGNAAKSYVADEFNKLGANTIMLRYRSNLTENDLLTLHDIDIIAKAMPEVKYISAQSSNYGYVSFSDKSRTANIVGVTSGYTNLQDFEIAYGRFINEDDIEGNRKVAFVDDMFARRYFGKTNIIGQEIKVVNNSNDIIKLRVIGVQDTSSNTFASMMDNEDYPTSVIIPISTYQAFNNNKYLDEIDLSVDDKSQVKSAGDKLVKLLSFVHQNEDKYMATSVQDVQKSVNGVLNVVSSVLLVIAVITLIVGGIGIINILLVSVTERIREIGVRKALGARKKDIVLQFLTESIMMTGFSGIIGIILGIICGAIISAVIKIPPVVDIKTIISAFSGSVILGIIFGVYPAKKAADLNPIESLRYE